MTLLANLCIASGVAALICLLLLHFTSPEFKPSWRMISEYALGSYKWLITSFFLLWGTSSVFLSLLLWNAVTTKWAMLGIVLLLVSALGEIMGGLFDVKHKLHGMAFGLGVPTVPVAALLIGYNLVQSDPWSGQQQLILFMSHSVWISLVIMALSMILMFSGFKKAGVEMQQNFDVEQQLPVGVFAFGGYANRLLVLCYVLWMILVAYTCLPA